MNNTRFRTLCKSLPYYFWVFYLLRGGEESTELPFIAVAAHGLKGKLNPKMSLSPQGETYWSRIGR